MNAVASIVQLMLFLIQIIACTTGSMPRERNYCNCHNKNNLTDCLFFNRQQSIMIGFIVL